MINTGRAGDCLPSLRLKRKKENNDLSRATETSEDHATTAAICHHIVTENLLLSLSCLIGLHEQTANTKIHMIK